MTEAAIRKINAEMQKTPDDTFTEVIGHYLIDRSIDTMVAAAVNHESRTLGGAVKAVLNTARTKAKNNAAVLSPGEVFGIVDNYFGIPTDRTAQRKAVEALDGPAEVVTAAPGKLAALDFDSFI